MPEEERFRHAPCGACFMRCPLTEISTFLSGQQPKLRELIVGYWFVSKSLFLFSCDRIRPAVFLVQAPNGRTKRITGGALVQAYRQAIASLPRPMGGRILRVVPLQMKILVTGATGFLGGALTEALLRDGQPVRILVRLGRSVPTFASGTPEVCWGSLEDASSLVAACDGIELIYHCAALASDWGPWEQFYQTNVQGVENLLGAVQTAGSVRRFIHISTADVYGYPVAAVDETYPITDVGLPYNRSKVLGEKKVWEFSVKTGLPVTVIRPSTIYGPRSLSIVVEIAAVIRKKQMALIDGGRVAVGLLYIDNAVEGILQAARLPATIGQAYNLRDESDETWRQFISMLASGMGISQSWMSLPTTLAMGLAYLCEAVYRVLGIRRRPLVTRHAVYQFCRTQNYSIKKAQQDFGYRSKIGFAEGMARTQSWLASPEGQAALAKF